MTPYDEYMQLDAQLVALIERGEDESDEGDALRDKMDPLWRQLTTEQKLELNKDVQFPDVGKLGKL